MYPRVYKWLNGLLTPWQKCSIQQYRTPRRFFDRPPQDLHGHHGPNHTDSDRE